MDLPTDQSNSLEYWHGDDIGKLPLLFLFVHVECSSCLTRAYYICRYVRGYNVATQELIFWLTRMWYVLKPCRLMEWTSIASRQKLAWCRILRQGHPLYHLPVLATSATTTPSVCRRALQRHRSCRSTINELVHANLRPQDAANIKTTTHDQNNERPGQSSENQGQ